MKKIIFIIIPSIILALIVFLGFQFFFNRTNAKGALQVTSDPKSKVYLNGKLVGETPLCLCGPDSPSGEGNDKEMVTVGEYEIKLEPTAGATLAFEEKIKIERSVLTVVDRKFGKTGESEGSVISLSPLEDTENIELQVLTFPEGAEITLDSASAGSGPLLLNKDITESDHSLLITKDGYKEKTLRIRTPKGYRLTAIVYLAVDGASTAQNGQEKKASPSAALTPKATSKKIRISQTPNGFLRVREEASVTAAEVTRVNTGQEFEVTDEETGWYKIKLPTGTEGWVSAQFAAEIGED
jgi:hypothetical protein